MQRLDRISWIRNRRFELAMHSGSMVKLYGYRPPAYAAVIFGALLDEDDRLLRELAAFGVGAGAVMVGPDLLVQDELPQPETLPTMDEIAAIVARTCTCRGRHYCSWHV